MNLNKLVLSIFVLFFSSSAFSISTNPHAPTLENVVVAFDVAEKTFSPFLFKLVPEANVTLSMVMDPTCSNVRIQGRQVECLNQRRWVKAGTLGKNIGQDDIWALFQVNWLSHIELTETITSRGYIYKLKLR